ncbi:MAG: DUF3575 domain-containing protein [Cytophagales bacterium]|nr:MAG: DUF3575 domain-containing protein [Cytophagales bacterium]
MRNKITYTLILTGLLFISSYSLVNAEGGSSLLRKKNDDPKNVVKLQLGSLFFGALHFQYERALTSKISVALGASYLIPRSLPIAKYYEFDSTRINESNLSGFSLTPEVRFYLGKKDAPRGFYIAPYMRYNNYSMDFDVDSRVNLKTGQKNVEKNFVGEGKYTSIGGGVMIGAQWLIINKISIDWWILGLGFNSTKMELVSRGDFSKLDLSNSVNEINSFDSPLINAKGYADDKEIRAELTLPGLAFRGGLTIGYAF